jgi:anthranilate synthase component 1
VFLSYELSGEIEPGLRLPRSSLPWQAFALRVRSGIVHELASGRMFAFAEPECEGLLDQICADVEAAVLDRPNGGGRSVPAADPLPVTCTVQGLREEPAELFLTRVHAARARIAAGDIYQANLSRWWCAQLVGDGSPAALYESLRRANPAPFAGLLQWGGLCVLSSSPERLVRTLGGTVHTRPIAGTRPRSGSALRERAETDALIANAKERAEHIMLVDLERNDLGRICERGTVRVEELMTIESYAHVHHIVSRVEGRLRCGVTPVEVIRATFPGGTITGCPKYRCMQLIAELEKEGRGAYTGSMGYLNLNGDLDLNILIRTMTVTGGTVEFRAGAGIVADSDPVRELEETRAKARGMLAALAAAPED